MEKKPRRTFLRDAGLGGTVLAGFGLGAGSAAAESFSVDGISVTGTSGDWSTFHANAARSGYTETPGPLADPTAHRFRQSSPSIDSNLAVADGVAYFVQDGRNPVLVAFDLAAEVTVWEADVVPGSEAGVTVADGTVYVVGGSQQTPDCHLRPPALAAVDAADGAVLWEHEFGPGTVTWPTVANGSTYVVEDDELVAVDSEGSEAWRTALADETAAGRSTLPALADGLVVVADEAGVVALDADDGSEAWRYELADAAEPAISDGSVYAAGQTGIVALDIADGTERWRTDGTLTTGAAQPTGAPAVSEEHVYVPMDEEYVEAFSKADGASAWRSDHVGDVSIAVGGDVVYAVDSTRFDRQFGVFALDAADGAAQWEHRPESRFAVDAPVVADGALLFGGDTLTVLTE